MSTILTVRQSRILIRSWRQAQLWEFDSSIYNALARYVFDVLIGPRWSGACMLHGVVQDSPVSGRDVLYNYQNGHKCPPVTVPPGVYGNEKTYEIGFNGEEIRGPETIKVIALCEGNFPPRLLLEKNWTDEAADKSTTCVDE